MEKISESVFKTLNQSDWKITAEALMALPEKILQFGTGVLLRGLPDYFVDQANKQGVFNGRIVVVKSTQKGDTDDFDLQDGLYAHVIRGIRKGEKVDKVEVNASISRVLTAADDWMEILSLAANPDLEIVISNTTEVGLTYLEESIDQKPPASFPAKLVAWLAERFKKFNGDQDKGIVIVPTELVVENGKLLQSICNEVAVFNNLSKDFIQWMNHNCHFCDSLVDRIVPGKLSKVQQSILEDQLGFSDRLSIISEPYALWAIEAKNAQVKDKLSFSSVNPDVVIAPDIQKFRKLKLHLLNGTHTFCCGLAVLCHFDTVSESMENPIFKKFITYLTTREIIPGLLDEEISLEEAKHFSSDVLDRFANPFIEHHWQSITLNYSSKMKIRNGRILEIHYKRNKEVPEAMAICLAAMLRYLKIVQKRNGTILGSIGEKIYEIQDADAPKFQRSPGEEIYFFIDRVLGQTSYWEQEDRNYTGLIRAVGNYYEAFQQKDAQQVLIDFVLDKA